MPSSYIKKRKGVVGGKPAIAGTRIKVSHIALRYFGAGDSVAELTRRYPHLTPAQIHSALAYFYEHPDEILSELFAELETIREQLSPEEHQRLQSQLTLLVIEGLRFTELYESPDEARDAAGVYLVLDAASKSRVTPVHAAAAHSIRAALQEAHEGTHRYAVRYAPFEESQRIAQRLREWLQLP